MSVISPTITAENAHTYREQMERIAGFAVRIHIDLMDGIFTKNKSVALSQAWLQEGPINDIHIMYQHPESALAELVALKPHLVVVHAESSCDFAAFASSLHTAGIKCGIALFPETPVSSVADSLPIMDHLLIFSGNLGHQGGSVANLELLKKIGEAKAINPDLEIAWDGGAAEGNVVTLAQAGVDVINVGGAIHHTPDAAAAYKKLQQLISS